MARSRSRLVKWVKQEWMGLRQQLQLQAEACSRKKQIKCYRKDFAGFCRYYLPHIAQVEAAPFQLQMAQALARDANAIVVCQWARGLSKTTTARMVVLWLLCRGDLHFGLLASSSHSKALKLLDELYRELDTNDRLCADFGLALAPGHRRRGDFALTDGRGFRAYGKGQNPRGEQLKSRRPDFIWLDDIDDDHECRNPRRTRQSYHWVMESLYPAGILGATRLLAVNNVIAPHSIIQQLAQVPGAQVMRVNMLDEQGQPTWPQKYRKADIDLMIARLGYAASQQEYFNNPIATGALIRAEHLHYGLPPATPPTLLAYIDPSWTETGDYKAVALVGAQAGTYWLLDCFCRRCSMAELVAWCHAAQQRWQAHRWYMEASFHQRQLISQFVEYGQQQGKMLPLLADTRQKEPKATRIGKLASLFEQGLVRLHHDLKTSPDHQTLVAQLLALEAGSHAHDDGPDALEGAISLLIARGAQPTMPVVFSRKKDAF